MKEIVYFVVGSALLAFVLHLNHLDRMCPC